MPLTQVVADVVQVGSGKQHRDDASLPRTGGPKGNARLTAWLGLLLLVLSLAQLVTLLDVRGLITWHLALGLLLVPPALVKTATTGWRLARYYGRVAVYRRAGPPPLLLRLLGPLVVASTLGVLGTGLALAALGPERDRSLLFSALGQDVSPLTLHQVTFIAWAAATGLHLLGRFVPALRLTVLDGVPVPGAAWRGSAVAGVGVAAAVTTELVLGAVTSWTSGDLRRHDGPSRDSGRTARPR